MGAISLIFYNMKNPPINIDFSRSFLRMRNRGEDDTQIGSDSTPTLSTFNLNQISSHLSRREISEYRPITFQYGYHRLSINDASLDGSQPFEDPIRHKMLRYPELRSRPKRKLLCNGEIFNYHELRSQFNFSDRDLQSSSDVEIILPMYIDAFSRTGDSTLALVDVLNKINGDYSFILMENTNSFSLKDINIFVARDPLGTKPMYMVKYVPSKPESNQTDIFYMFVTEIKGIPLHILNDPEYIVQEVPPGTFWSYKNSIVDKSKDDFIQYYDFKIYKSLDICTINTADPDTISELYNNIKEFLTKSIIDRYELTEKSIGLLLSGGFDSCIMLSILIKHLVNKYNYSFPLHVFTIGDVTNSDVIDAKKHVEHLEMEYGIDIHHHIVQIQDMNLVKEDLTNIIVKLETYDKITVQKAIPMWFLLKYIKQFTDIRVLLSGEGLDELCGYDELFKLTDTDFQNKSVELLQNLSKYDLLRSDKLAGSFGLEIRYPFLDMKFIEYMLHVHPMLKRPQMSGYSNNPVEKYIIRKAFDTDSTIHIDKSLLWSHHKDIRSSFDDLTIFLKNYFDKIYSDLDVTNYRDISLPFSLLPKTKEELHYKRIFETYYPDTSHVLPTYWNSIWNK